jgi:flagellar basal-body rod protein FlgC
MSFNKIYDVASSALSAQRLRIQLISANVANSETTRTPEGGPFVKKDAVFQAHMMGKTADGMPLAGVRVPRIHISKDPFVYKYDPSHPDANEDGIVAFPNVNPIEEMVNLTEATRSFEANVAVVRAVRAMGQSAIEILRTS